MSDPLQQRGPGQASTSHHVQSPPQPASRVQAFRQLLDTPRVDKARLQELAFQGVPDEPGIRPLVWKLLLGYLPEERTQWDRHLEQRRAQYAQFCEDLIVKPEQLSGGGPPPGARAGGSAAGGLLRTPLASAVDHPLSTSGDSKWQAYFKDQEALEQIERDVVRTHPDMHFFGSDTPGARRHRQEMARALFVFSKLNPGLAYVQGMNELLAPLYYLFATDPGAAGRRGGGVVGAEADSFFCFVELMAEFRDNFCQQLDNSVVGIRAALGALSSLLRRLDGPLWEHLERRSGVNPQFYAFRWVTLLLTQEFAFPDVMRLWDALLSDPAGRADCLLRLCAAMLLAQRDQLLQGDFAACMKLLQNYPPPADVLDLARRAEGLTRVKSVLVLDDGD